MKTLIVVEDDPFLLEDLVFYGEQAGYNVVEIESVARYFDEIEKVKASSLILLDLSMDSGGNIELSNNQLVGEVLLQNIRDINEDVPIVVVSAYPERFRKIKEGVVTKCVNKPVHFEEIERVLREFS